LPQEIDSNAQVLMPDLMREKIEIEREEKREIERAREISSWVSQSVVDQNATRSVCTLQNE